MLALGESLNEFIPSNNIRIGVNDIAPQYNVDYKVVVDAPHRFTKERLHTIIQFPAKKFFTHLPVWQTLVNNVELFKCCNGRGNLKRFDTHVSYSNNSPYVAVIIAYKLGAKRINIYGADFNNHHSLKGSNRETALKHFKALVQLLNEKEVNVFTASQSSLAYFVPVLYPK